MVCRINHRPLFAPVVGYAFKASKCPELVATSLCGATPAEMAREFQNLATKNTRCKCPVVHVVLSPAQGETLSRKQWLQICERVAKELGASQWAAALHNDTAIQHCSLILSRVGPDGRTWTTSNDRYRLRKVCREFELEHGLRPTAARSQAIRVNKDEIEKAARLYKEGKNGTPIPERLAIAAAVKAALQQSTTLNDFEECLRRQQVVTRWRHDEQGRPIGVSFGRGEACITGRHAGVSCRMLTLHFAEKGTVTHEQSRRTEIPGRTSAVARAASPEDRGNDPGRFAGTDDGPGGNPQPAEGPNRSAGQLFGADSTPVREVGDLVIRAVSGLAAMCNDMVKDGERFNWDQIRRIPRHPRRFVPRARTMRREMPL